MVDASWVIRDCRRRSGLSLQELAERAGTSAATLSAYEHGRVVPRADTLDRVVRAAGYALDAQLVRRRTRGTEDRGTKDQELQNVLELAFAFPFRKQGELTYPPFGRRR